MADLTISNLVIEYTVSGADPVRPIDGLNLQVGAGSLVVLLGPSGCGKTTLLSCLGGILSPTSGSIHFGAVEVSALSRSELTEYRRRKVGIVFQSFNLVASLTALENVMVPMWAAGWTLWESQQRAHALLTSVGLHDRVSHHPGRLSGGQQQRVAVARALALDPPLILADEPTAQLDFVRAAEVLRLLREAAAGDRIVVVSTHDTRILPLADLVIQLSPSFTPAAQRQEGQGGQGVQEVVVASRGSALLDHGSVEDLIYVVADGEVEIVPGSAGSDPGLLKIGTPGDYAGPVGSLFHIPRGSTVRPRGEATLVSYTVEAFHRQFGPGVPQAGVPPPAAVPQGVPQLIPPLSLPPSTSPTHPVGLRHPDSATRPMSAAHPDGPTQPIS
ncbi:MAG TPA: ATP-binding cassette domain-containing protein [Mycobacterium sp.]|nr:ATP-binding cassette domain-containing protein [Mycobacterium sp.]